MHVTCKSINIVRDEIAFAMGNFEVKKPVLKSEVNVPMLNTNPLFPYIHVSRDEIIHQHKFLQSSAIVH